MVFLCQSHKSTSFQNLEISKNIKVFMKYIEENRNQIVSVYFYSYNIL